MFASLYRAMRDVGMPNPRQVDELEIWETAVLTGVDDYKSADDDKYAHLRARVAHEIGQSERAALDEWERGGRRGPRPETSDNLDAPKPEWVAPTEEEMALMSVLSSGSSLT